VPPDAAARAAALLRLWNDVALQHVSMGGACACGMGGVTLRLQDFERDILDYLRDEAGRLGEAEAHALLERHAPAGQEGGVAAVLAALADPGNDAAAAGAAWLLGRLDRTLSSFARLHGGARSGALP
jgi:hypothetical protein